ncbi:COG3904 family protein [Roseibium sp. LAB1]
MKVFRLLFCWLACFASVTCSANAADFAEGGDAELICVATISGQIAPGDTEKLKTFLAGLWEKRDTPINGVVLGDDTGNRSHGRLCLDSPGGSLSEAIRMADYLLKGYGSSYWVHGLGTAVPAGARCESACAVFFMAGGENTESDIGRIADRVLHVNGKLGFHSISLTLREGTYSRDDVGKAFGLALKSMGAVAARMEALRLRLSLLQTMLATPPDDMYFVEKIGDAAHWNIQVAGLPKIARPTSSNIAEACSKLSRQYTPEDGATPANYSAEQNEDNPDAILPHSRWSTVDVTPDSFQSYKINETDGIIEFVTDGGTELGDIGCSGRFDIGRMEMSAQVEASNGWYVAVPNFFMYPGDMTFSEIMSLAEGAETVSLDQIVAKKLGAPQKGSCLVFKGDTNIDDEPCDMTSLTSLNAGLESYTLESYQWPSGSITVIERQADKVLVNGALAETLWRKTKPKPVAEDWETSCLKNTSSGNVFCFKTTS